VGSARHGSAFVGNIQSSDRAHLDGDRQHGETAARLQSLTRPEAAIAIDDHARRRPRRRVDFARHDDIAIRGRCKRRRCTP
jgi:class 3 adenylate cyclase